MSATNSLMFKKKIRASGLSRLAEPQEEIQVEKSLFLIFLVAVCPQHVALLLEN